MLRDDKDVALNAVLVACRKAADHYSQAVKLADGPEWSGRFERLARLRSAHAEHIERLVRRFGYLPREPDQDRRDISRLLTLTRATVTQDSQTPLREKASKLEGGIEVRILEALALEWPTEAFDLLRDVAQSSRDVRDELTSKA